MKLMIEIPMEFEFDYASNKFEDALLRLKADAHCVAGNYEKETADMLIKALKNSEVVE